MCVTATRRFPDGGLSAPSTNVLPRKNIRSRPSVKTMPIQIGLPGNASYAFMVQGFVYDLAKAVLSLFIVTPNQPKKGHNKVRTSVREFILSEIAMLLQR